MQILPIRTGLLQRGDDLAEVLRRTGMVKPGDIVVVSSKVIAVTGGAAVDLKSIEPGAEAKKLAGASGLDPRFAELVIRETKRMNGKILGTCPSAILTELKPRGMKRGRILCPNAGIDQSNADADTAVPWPLDAAVSAARLSKELGVGIVISDSCCTPGRQGVVAFALTVAGFDPVRSQVGEPDLYGKKLRITQEAQADQLATAANAVMGNASQSTPAAAIRDHGIVPSGFSGWVEGIEPQEDLFRGLI